MVVPRSSVELAKDDEFSLFAVTVFKKHSAEFVHKVRERRWTPREWKFNEGGREAEEREQQKLEKDERRVWGEALRLGRTGYSDAVMAWIHVLALRVFVETVLRYGLPLSFVCGLVKVRRCNAILDIYINANLNTRRTRSWSRRPRRTSMAPTHTLAETLSVATRRAESPRTMLKWPTTCKQLAMLVRTTAHSSSISSRLHEHSILNCTPSCLSHSGQRSLSHFCFPVHRHSIPSQFRRLSIQKKELNQVRRLLFEIGTVHEDVICD